MSTASKSATPLSRRSVVVVAAAVRRCNKSGRWQQPTRDVDDVKERNTVIATLGRRAGGTNRAGGGSPPEMSMTSKSATPSSRVATLGRRRRRRSPLRRIGQMAAADRRCRRRQRARHHRRTSLRSVIVVATIRRCDESGRWQGLTGDADKVKERDTVVAHRDTRSSLLPPSAGATNWADGGGQPETSTTSKSMTPLSPKPSPLVRPPKQGSCRDCALDGNDGIGRGRQYAAPASSAKSQIMMKQQSNLPA